MFDVLILGVTDASRDPRLHRQIEALKGKYYISVMANCPPQDSNICFFPRVEPSIIRNGSKSLFQTIARTLRGCGFIKTVYVFIRYILIRSVLFQPLSLLGDKYLFRRKIIRQIQRIPSRLILANDLSALPLAVWAAGGRPIIFDAHEYYPGQFSRTRSTLFRRKYDYYVLKHFLPKCAALSTVGEGIASLYRNIFGGFIEIVMNTPEYEDLKPTKTHESIRFVHHGAAMRGRNLESLLDAFSRAGEGNTFDLYLVRDDGGYVEQLKEKARSINGVTIHPPVPMTTLAKVLNSYDVGLYALPMTTFNQKWALPNKLFEFIQARLAIVIGPSPEMSSLVHSHDLGIVSDGFDSKSLALAIQTLTPQRIMHFKENACKAALELSSETQKAKIFKMVFDILNNQDKATC